ENLREMGLRGIVKRVDDLRQGVDDGLVLGYLAVEDPKRVSDGATMAIDAHLWREGDECGSKHLVVAGAGGGGGDGGCFKFPASDAQLIEERGEHFEDFGVAEGALAA